MAESCTIIVLPLVAVERRGVDLSSQRLAPASDRRNIVDLARRRDERERAAQRSDDDYPPCA